RGVGGVTHAGGALRCETATLGLRLSLSSGRTRCSMQATALCRSISSFDGVKSANNHRREDHMHSLHHRSLRRLLLAGAVMLTAMPAVAADVTPDRLTNPQPRH